MARNRLSKSAQNEEIAGYLFIMPAVLIILCMVILPIIASLVLSFMDYNIIKTPSWKGIANFRKLFTGDSRLWVVTKNSMVYMVMALIGNVGGGLLLALLLNRAIPKFLNNFFRFSFFLPVIIGYTYVATVWRAMYATDNGIFNYLLEQIGIARVGWLTDKSIVMLSIIIMDTWKNAGYYMIIFIAGLKNIPRHYYEAAQLDGCSGANMFFRITFPLLSPTIFFNVIYSSINAIQAFDSMSILTNGGPGDASRSIVMYIYETGFQSMKFGYASSIAMMLFAMVAILTGIQFLFSRKWVNY